MPIEIHLDRVMLERKMSLVELSKQVGITNINLSKLKTGKVSAVRLSTLEAICEALDCQPGDILEYTRPDSEETDGRRPSVTIFICNP
jgi:putative transcriptional regulator